MTTTRKPTPAQAAALLAAIASDGIVYAVSEHTGRRYVASATLAALYAREWIQPGDETTGYRPTITDAGRRAVGHEDKRSNDELNKIIRRQVTAARDAFADEQDRMWGRTTPRGDR